MFNSYKHPDKIFDYARLYTVSVLCSLLYGQRAVDLESFWFKDFYHMMEHVRPPSFTLTRVDTNINIENSGLRSLSQDLHHR